VSENVTTVLLTFRDTIRRRSPPWLQRGLAEKILYSIGVQCDAFADAVIAGVKQRFPGYYSFDALPKLGRERRIPRGRSEDDVSYAARLGGFLASHQTRGGPYALLSQLFRYWSPSNFPIELVYYTGAVRYAMDVAGNVVRDLVPWVADTNAAKWARWWLFYYTDQWASTPPTDAELAEIRLIPRQWNAAHPLGTIVLISATGELWNWPLGHTWNESGTWNTSGGSVRFVDVEPT
jgi:hypothetical protein